MQHSFILNMYVFYHADIRLLIGLKMYSKERAAENFAYFKLDSFWSCQRAHYTPGPGQIRSFVLTNCSFISDLELSMCHSGMYEWGGQGRPPWTTTSKLGLKSEIHIYKFNLRNKNISIKVSQLWLIKFQILYWTFWNWGREGYFDAVTKVKKKYYFFLVEFFFAGGCGQGMQGNFSGRAYAIKYAPLWAKPLLRHPWD